MKAAVAAWDRFWFAPADPTPLGLMRLVAGLVTLYAFVVAGLHLDDWYGRDGLVDLRVADELRRGSPWPAPPTGWKSASPTPMPADADARATWADDYARWLVDPRGAERGNYTFSLWYHVVDPTAMALLHVFFLVVAVLFTAGWKTRLTGAVTWLAALGYTHRAAELSFGFDAVHGAVLLYLTIGPSGAALSLERLLEQKRLRREGKEQPAPTASASAGFALRLCQLHLCLIYAAAGLGKLLGPAWWNGVAAWMLFVNADLLPTGNGTYATALRWLVGHRWLQEIVQCGVAYGTVGGELLFPVLVWGRWRWAALGTVFLLHLGIGLLMDIGTFSIVMLTLVLAFVPAEAVQGVLQRVLSFSGRSRDGALRVT